MCVCVNMLYLFSSVYLFAFLGSISRTIFSQLEHGKDIDVSAFAPAPVAKPLAAAAFAAPTPSTIRARKQIFPSNTPGYPGHPSTPELSKGQYPAKLSTPDMGVGATPVRGTRSRGVLTQIDQNQIRQVGNFVAVVGGKGCIRGSTWGIVLIPSYPGTNTLIPRL